MGHTSPSSLRRLGPSRLRRAVMAIGVVSASVLTGMTVHSPAANAWPTANVTIYGHGFGHGRGMGQWGAYGYATIYGWTYQQILAHYYGGTKLVDTTTKSVTVNLSAHGNEPLRVTSSSASFVAGGVAIPAGRAITLTYRPSTNNYLLAQTSSCASSTPVVASKVVTSSVVSADTTPGNLLSRMLTFCDDKRSYRGTLKLVASGGSTYAVNTVGLEDYVRGVVPRESSPSWGDAAGGKGMAALQAQAVAARSYVLVQNRLPGIAGICDTTSCQVYGGAGLNGSLLEDPRTNTAVTDTAGKRLIDSAGHGVSAEYSASTGGWTAGGQFPAVEDLGDIVAPQHNWTVTVPASQLADDFGVGTLTAITVLERNGFGTDGGRAESVQITGTSGTVTTTGFGFQGAEGLMSDWFSIVTSSPTISYAASATSTTLQKQGFGTRGDIPITCDWDGDGKASGGVFRPSDATFYLRNSLAAGAPLTVIPFGNAWYLPVCGDWDGNGTQTIGVFNPATAIFSLRNSNTAGAPVTNVRLGGTGDVPVAGDWTGSGKDTVGVYRPSTSTFYLIDENSSTAPRHTYPYSTPGIAQLPVIGDWDGNKTDTLGVYHGGLFYLTNLFGTPTSLWNRIGSDGCRPLAGNWYGGAKSSVAIACGY